MTAKYTEFHKIDLSYLKKLLSKKQIVAQRAQKLIDYYNSRLSDNNDPLYTEYFDYFLFFESIKSAVLSAFAYEIKKDKILNQFGIMDNAIPDIIKTITQNTDQVESGKVSEFTFRNEKFSLWFKEATFEQDAFLIVILFPRKAVSQSSIERIYNVFLRYYIPDIFKPDNRFLSFFDDTNERIMAQMMQSLAVNKPVTISYFKFQPLGKFLVLAGEHYATDVVNGLVEILTSRLKKDDQCYVLNPREYIVVSNNCESEIMQKRFHKMIFEVKSLFLDYEVKMTTIREPFNSLSDIWQDLVPENHKVNER